MRPMPFWPSFEPCAKETPVQVAMSKRADAEGRWVCAFGRLVEGRIFGEELEGEVDQGGQGEADDRRDDERLEHLGDLLPVNAGGAGAAIDELVGEPHPEDGADHGVRAGDGQTAPPGEQVPKDGGDEQGEDHGEAGAGGDLEDELDREQRDDGKGDRARARDDADEVPDAGPGDGDMRLKRVGVDDGGDGVGCVVEAVDELKAESDQKCCAQKDIREDRSLVDGREIARQGVDDVDDATDEQKAEECHPDLAAGAGFAACKLLVEHGRSGSDGCHGRRLNGEQVLKVSSR